MTRSLPDQLYQPEHLSASKDGLWGISWKELGTLLLVLTLFTISLSLMGDRLWPVWLDEVNLTDPAANWFLGNGFTSSAWYNQPKDEFWASNAPFHTFLLGGWMQLFGFSLTSVRMLNYVEVATAIAFIYGAVCRLNLVVTWRDRLIMVALMLLSYGVSFNYLSGRYDSLAIAIFAAGFLTYTFPVSRLRSAVFVLLGILIPITGFHLVPYALLIVALLVPFAGWPLLRPFVWLCVGMVLGLGGVMVLYAYHGVLYAMIETIGGHAFAGTVDVPNDVKSAPTSGKILFILQNIIPIVLSRFSGIVTWYIQDASYLLLLLAMMLMGGMMRAVGEWHWRSPLGFGFVAALLVPFGMGFARDYPEYYGWMAIVPMAIAITATLPSLRHAMRRSIGFWLVTVCLIAACVPGTLSRMMPALTHWQDRDYGQVIQFVNTNIEPNERVYSDFGPYYPIRKQVDYVLLPGYLVIMSDEEKAELTTLLLDLRQKHRNYEAVGVFDEIGGTWEEAEAKLDTDRYQLRIFRRVSEAT